jgi:endoglucanase
MMRLVVPAIVAAAFGLTGRDAPPSAAASTRAPLAGINLAGGEFNSARKPGVYGKDYIYPTARTAAPFIEGGMQIVRMPVLWERIQPKPGEPLNSTEMTRVDRALAQLGGFQVIVLDVHNYGKLRGERLDRLPDGGAQLAGLWAQLADRYRRDPRIAFGLMNEPNGIPARQWRAIVDQSVRAIRATGARNLILVPGTNWSGAHSWTRGGADSNAAAFVDFRDPGGNFAFEMHQYLDRDNSGTNSECVDPESAARRIEPATEWLRRNRRRGFLGEFGAPASEACLAALRSLLGSVQRAPDVWFGWAYWAGGDWWGKYPMNVQPSRDGPKPQMAVLSRFIRGGAQ